jgi:hypothetical protein
MVVVAFTDGKIGQWRYVAKDLVGGRSLRSEAPEKQEHQAKGLQKWTWQNGDQTVARLITRDVSETAPTSDGTKAMAQHFPPEGGVGLRASARWAWYPKAGSDDELLFPRGAEIKEIEDINGDWFFGSYMGTRGLFPAPYVRLDQRSQGDNWMDPTRLYQWDMQLDTEELGIKKMELIRWRGTVSDDILLA